MIWESGPWKREVWKVAEKVDRRRSQRRWPAASFSLLEMEFFGAFYAVRKLIEARKLSDEMIARRVCVQVFAPRGNPVHFMNWDKLDELYDLDASEGTDQVALREFANQAIHSYVFVPSVTNEGLEGFFVSSDRNRTQRLWYANAKDVVQVLREVGNDDIRELEMHFSPKEGGWIIDREAR